MCHPKCIFTLQLVAARLHDQATTSKGIQRATEILFFLLVAILWSGAVTLDIILVLSDEVRKLTSAITSLVWLREVICDKIV